MQEISMIRNLSDIEKIETIPYSEKISVKSTIAAIEKGAAINPDAVALSFLMSGDTYETPIQITYQTLVGKIRKTANMLYDLGIGPEDVVTYVLPNIPQTHYVLWGAEAAGIVNPINPLLEAFTIKDICNAAGTKVLVTLTELPGTDIWQKIDSIRKEIPTLRHVIRIMGPSDPSENIIGFEEKVETYPADRLIFNREISPDDIASLYHTGGTTGTPKLAKRTHANEVITAWVITQIGDFQPGDTGLCGLPLFHCNGTIITGLAPFLCGSHVVLLSPKGFRDTAIIKNFYKIVAKFSAKCFSAVPTLLTALLDVPVEDADIASLKFVICGAAPLSVEVFKRFEAHTGIKILEGYGLTEGTVASALNPKDGERKIGSVGIRLPYQKIKIAITDDAGNYLRDGATDEIGTVCIHGPNVFKGYVEERHNRNIWIDERWFNTGDLGRLDKDGYLWLTGRKKELIIRGGHNIDPAIIEEPIYKMPDVKLVAAVGRPDAHAGEVPVVYVEVTEGAAISEQMILEWAKAHIGEKAAIPKEVIIIDQIPLTSVGKIFKPALKWDAIKRMYAKELHGLGELADSVDIQVEEHKIHGTLVKIIVKPSSRGTRETIEKRIGELLSRYTIRYEVEIPYR